MCGLPWLLIVLSSALAGPAFAGARAASDPRVSGAIAAAVRQRMGAGTEVIVESVEIFTLVDIASAGRIDVVPDPAAHFGGAVRFTLTVDGARTGHADAQLQVSIEHARAVRFVPKGATLTADDVEDVRDDVVSGPLRPSPHAVEVIGGRALRDLVPGHNIPPTAVAVPPAVRSGQTVTAVSRAFGVEVAATMVAAQSGNAGSVIRVVNRTTRKALRARIVSSEMVEIIHD